MGRVGDTKPRARLSPRLMYSNPWMTVLDDIVSLPDARSTMYRGGPLW